MPSCMKNANAIFSCYPIGLEYGKLVAEVKPVNGVIIGKYLSELRKYYKVTQDELAARLGVTRQAVSKWESLYGRETSAHMQELLATGKNSYLTLSDTTKLVTTYDGINRADYIVISVGSQQLQSVASEIEKSG